MNKPLEIPDRLKLDYDRVKDPIHVPVSLAPERALSMEHLQELQEKMGMAAISPQQIVALRDLGVAAKEIGILNTIRGTTLVSQQTLSNVIVDLGNKIEEAMDSEEKIKVARAIGYLAGQLSRVNSGSAKMEGVVIQAAQAKETKKKISFPLGRMAGPVIDVTPNQTPSSASS